MASGRLGSATLPPYNASLLYSNTSGLPASVNIQATVLSSTENSNIALAVDSASVAVNQTTTATTITSANINVMMYWLDPLYGTTPLRFDQVSPSNSSNTSDYPVSSWSGSAWTKPSTGYYGANGLVKIDPYLLTNPSAYGKTKASIVAFYQTSGSSYGQTAALYTDLSTFNASQFALLQQTRNPSGSTSSTVVPAYSGFGADGDNYTSKYGISIGAGGYMTVVDVPASSSGNRTSDSLIFNACGSNDIVNYTHLWYAPRIMGANGLFLVQPTGFNTSTFFIVDPALAVTLGSLAYAIYWAGTSTAGWYYMSSGYGSTSSVEWFDYNPNTNRYYFCTTNSSNRKVYSFAKSSLDALTSRGTITTYSVTSVSWLTDHGTIPWAGSNVMRPLRIGASLWWTASNNGLSYISTDLATWTLASSLFASPNYPSAYLILPKSTSSYVYATLGANNINLFDSGFSNVSLNSRLEFNTSFNNYQRTGIVISAGDKIYAQNFGSTRFSLTAMGYEG